MTTPAGPGAFLPAGRADRWVYGRRGAERARPPIAPSGARRAVRLGAGIPDLEPRIESVGHVHVLRPARRALPRGQAFLVGDAAHRVTPRGGTGMNTAIRDGHDLGWKLAWVLQGWAGAELLDTYEAERRPVAEHNVARSIDPDPAGPCRVDELAVDLGGRLRHQWLRSAPGVSTLDLVGPGLTVLAGPEGAAWHAAARARGAPPVAFHALDG